MSLWFLGVDLEIWAQGQGLFTYFVPDIIMKEASPVQTCIDESAQLCDRFRPRFLLSKQELSERPDTP